MCDTEYFLLVAGVMTSVDDVDLKTPAVFVFDCSVMTEKHKKQAMNKKKRLIMGIISSTS